MASTSSSSSKTVAIGWLGMPIEMVLASNCDTALMNRVKEISSAYIEQCAGAHVLIMGTYYEFNAAFVALAAGAASVTLAPYTSSTKYDGLAAAVGTGVPCTVVPLDTLGNDPARLPSTLLHMFTAPCLDTLALAMLRRGETLPGATATDNALFRGLEADAAAASVDIVTFLRNALTGIADASNPDALRSLIDAWVPMGTIIVQRDAAIGAANSAAVGIPVTLGGQATWLVTAPWSPVQPFVEAAVADAAKRGLLLGATMRWCPATNTTAFSVRPVPGTAGSTDFVKQAPFRGDGPPGGRGASTPSLLPMPTAGCVIEALFP